MTRASCRLAMVGAFVGDESLDYLLCGLAILLGIGVVVLLDSFRVVGPRGIVGRDQRRRKIFETRSGSGCGGPFFLGRCVLVNCRSRLPPLSQNYLLPL